ncbi:MAG TPA: penicillin acylase family protein, partial [Vicinamibacterales bacterium]|nr:penicillin acylase family protein [Vicinamibacterales bacterium]
GWLPELWLPEDLLNRTDAFLSSGDAELEAFRAQLVAEVGERRAAVLLPMLANRPLWPVEDLDGAGRAVADALRRAGAAPYFAGFAASFAGSNAWAIPASRSATGAPLVANDPHRPLTSPSLRYLIHLKAPGWNVIGAASPWLPGVVIGHNEHVAWGMAAFPANTEDVRVEPLDRAHDVIVKDALRVKRSKPFAFDREYTAHGVVIASDREHGRVFTLGWAGFEPGAASDLGALALDRAESLGDLQTAIAKWKMPVVEFVFADNTTVGRQVSGLDARASSASSAPVPIAANENVARTSRLKQLLSGDKKYSVDDLKRQQHDAMSWNAEILVPRLASAHAADARVEDARRQLLAWDRRVAPESPAGTLYVRWEQALWRRIAGEHVPTTLLDAYLAHVPFEVEDALKARDGVMLGALASAVNPESAADAGNRIVVFRHPLAITQAARRRFDVGPFSPGGDAETVMAFSKKSGLDVGASFRQILDVADWDRSVATSAPGQSQWTNSPHFADLAALWARGEYFPLPFSDRAVRQHAETTLILQPR